MLKCYLPASGGPSPMGETASASKLIASPQALSGESQSYRGWWARGTWAGKTQAGPHEGGAQGVRL